MTLKPNQVPSTGSELRPDCGNCFGLCCVVLHFSASKDFAIDKPAGTPCPNLAPDFGCGIHGSLRERGFRGCTVYDCQGAGQKVAQVTFGGRDWRRHPELAPQMFDAFGVMRHLHALLWYLTEALAMPRAQPLHAELDQVRAHVEAMTRLPAELLVLANVDAQRDRVRDLLVRVSETVRAGVGAVDAGRGGADLIGAELRGQDLRGADLVGSLLIAADLRGADLREADLMGADLRDADLRGADLTGCLFLAQAQLDAARGDATTRIPASLDRPNHWPA